MILNTILKEMDAIIHRLQYELSLNLRKFMISLKLFSHNKVDVLLVNPSSVCDWDKEEPTGLLFLAANLKKFDFQVKILDLKIQKLANNSIKKIIKALHPRIIGISAITKQALSAYSLGRYIKSNFPQTTLVYGGIHPSLFPSEAIEKGGADIVLIGEGEQALVDIAEEKNLEDIPGIVYIVWDKIKSNKKNNFVNLDSLPFPDYTSININNYETNIHFIKYHTKKAVNTIPSRGCYNNCAYCSSPKIYNRTLRFRSALNIVEEMRMLEKKFNILTIHFHDDDFLFDYQIIVDLCHYIKKTKLRIKWICLTSISTLVKNYNLLPLIKKAGCIGLEVGIENADKYILKQLNKRVDTKGIYKVNRLIRKNNLRVIYLHMSFTPGENIDTPYKNAKLYYELRIHKKIKKIPILKAINPLNYKVIFGDLGLHGHFFTPYPGTDIFKNIHELGIVTTNSYNDYFEGRLNFIPYSFLLDTPCVCKHFDRENLKKYIKEYKLNIIHYINCPFYITYDIVYNKFKSLEEYISFLCELYFSIDSQKKVEQYITEMEIQKNIKKDVIVTGFAMLSILGLIKSKFPRD